MITIKTRYGLVTCYRNDNIIVATMLRTGEIFEQDVIETHLAKYVRVARTILDIGAHVGNHTVMYANLNPSAVIHSFEPQLKLYELLEKNVSINNLGNVKIYHNAIGDVNKQVQMNNFITDGPNAYLRPPEYGTDVQFNLGGLSVGENGEFVNMITIDSLNLSGCDYMKIDTEGCERQVFVGAQNTIRKYKPVIFYESNSKVVPSNISMSAHDILKSFGYTIRDVGSDNFLAIPEDDFIKITAM